ncbi:MAG: hypothetical protein KC468_20190, partial [Myxococcales bacterium]|nr:hypothetical protein [Myxococcales bacterium]
GEEVNRSPTQAYRRYVINFGERSLEEAAAWPGLLAIVRERVKPARARLRDNTDGRRRRKYWWQFGRVTPALWRGLATVPRALVTSIVTKHLAFSFQPPDRVFSHKLQVFLLPGYEHFAVLQSRVHERWARLLSSTLETRLNYSASDCFETFPLPEAAALDPRGALAAAGRALYEARARFMLETGQGLTRTYNALVDPEVTDARVASLRALHRELDRAALAAYGWTELAPPPMTAPRGAHERAALARFEDELLDRLFALNARRAAAEREACLHEHVL